MNVTEAVNLLKSKVGCRYVWGANGPNEFDCSGLRYWWANATGNVRSDTTAQGFYNASVEITSGFKAGDMAFLYSSGYISHMAILIDADTVIEARGRAYGVVQTKLKDFLSRAGYSPRGVRRDPYFVLENDAPVETSHVNFIMGSYNAQAAAWGGNTNYKSDGNFLRRKMKCSVYALQEVTEANRNGIRAAQAGGPDRWLTWPNGLVADLWTSRKWQHHGLDSTLDLGTIAARGVRTLLTRVGTDLSFMLASIHIRPSAITDQAGKESDIKRVVKWLSDVHYPVAVGGDWNTSKARDIMVDAGYTLATPFDDTLDKAGNQVLDMIFVKNLTVRSSGVVDPGSNSDHKAVFAKLTIKA